MNVLLAGGRCSRLFSAQGAIRVQWYSAEPSFRTCAFGGRPDFRLEQQVARAIDRFGAALCSLWSRSGYQSLAVGWLKTRPSS